MLSLLIQSHSSCGSLSGFASASRRNHGRFEIFFSMQCSYYACHSGGNKWQKWQKKYAFIAGLYVRVHLAIFLCPADFEYDGQNLISKDRRCCSVSCTAITLSGTANSIWDCPCVEKRKLGSPFCPTAMQFLMSFWFASRCLFHWFYEDPLISPSFCSLIGCHWIAL